MIEQEITISSEGLCLSGTLALPASEGSFPCVLLIPGSGQVDRNENHKRLPINLFGELSRRMADAGMGSLRYDKRGVGRSEGDFWKAGFDTTFTDAAAALSLLREQAQVKSDQIFALGHSEGAYIAIRLAAEDSGLAGAVLLAGGARSGEEELRWQGLQVTAGLTGFNRLLLNLLRIDPIKSQMKHLDRIKRSTEDTYRAQLVTKIRARWMREFLAYDPSQDLAKIEIPLLAITGSKDIQVDPGNLPRMASLVKGPFEYHVVPDVTHLLRREAGVPSISTYKKQIREPVDQRVVDLILDWLRRQVARDRRGVDSESLYRHLAQ